MRIVVPSLFFALLGAVAPVSAQSPYVSVIGLVDKIDTAGKAMTVKEENGTAATVKYDETATSFLLLPPGEKDTKKATPAKLENVGVGDHVLARVLTADPTGKPARTVYIEKADALAKEKADEWKNDTEGTVISVDAGAKQIKFNARQTAGPAKEMTIELGGKVLFTRYNPATAKYDPSALASIKVGDQLRVIGEKNAGSTEIKATVIGSATFRAVGVLVKTVDAANHQLTGTEAGSNKTVVVAISTDTPLKKFTDETATMVARALNPTMQNGRGNRGGGGGGEAPGGGAPGGRGGGRGGRRNVDLDKVIDQQPAIQLAELKPKDEIIVLGAFGDDASKMWATKLVSGAGPILHAAPDGVDPLAGSWNMGVGGGGGE